MNSQTQKQAHSHDLAKELPHPQNPKALIE